MSRHVWDSKSQAAKILSNSSRNFKTSTIWPFADFHYIGKTCAQRSKKETDFKVVPCCQTKQATAERRAVFRVVKIHKNPFLNRQLYPNLPCNSSHGNNGCINMLLVRNPCCKFTVEISLLWFLWCNFFVKCQPVVNKWEKRNLLRAVAPLH